jgi:photosystem II stability/assembly factor-like uncharacterized protein
LNMLKLSFWRLLATLLVVSLVQACGGGAGSSAPAPGGFTVTPGNGQAIVSWTASAGVQYWLMYAPTATPIDISNPPGNHAWATNISSPYVMTGLTNGVTYSFAMNARTDGGKGGAQTASQSVTPHYGGTKWLAGAGAGTSNLRGLAYGTSTADSLNYFLAVGDGGAVYKALDGVSQSITGYAWTPVSTAPALAYKAALNALSKYIAVSASGAIVSSADLSTWTTATSPVSSSLNALAGNGSVVVAVGDGGKVLYSTDALTWTTGTVLPAGFTSKLSGVAYSATVGWVAVGQGGSLLTSTDGVNWTVQTAMATPAGNDLNGVSATSAGVFVAVGNNGTVMRSTNGTSWTAQALTTGAHLYAVSTDSAQFLAAGAGGVLFSSLDGVTWSTITQTAATGDLLSIVGSVSKYMVVGTAGAAISSIN